MYIYFFVSKKAVLHGCITILKTLALSKVIYLLITEVNIIKATKYFLCAKTAQIKHTAMIGPKLFEAVA